MYEQMRSIVQAHASLQRGVHQYPSDWTNVSRALPARQARDGTHTSQSHSGTHASGKY